jgi:hypothetical protein
MDLSSDDIMRLCGEVRRLSQKVNWQWKGLPVAQWEFATIADFARAKMQLERAISPMMIHTRSDASWQRALSPSVWEVDANGVTFRLVCREEMQTPRGSLGATQIRYTEHKKE